MSQTEALSLLAIETFVSISECKELSFCDIRRELQDDKEVALVIDCPASKSNLTNDSITQILGKLWEQRYPLLTSATILGLTGRLILKRGGYLFGSVSSPSSFDFECNTMSLPVKTATSCDYSDLLNFAAVSEYPAFFVEIPKNWHWGQPQRCFLTSAQVTEFSGRVAPKWHGDDVTLLFDRSEFERRHEAMMKALSKTPEGSRAIVTDFEYRSFSVDGSRDLLCRAAEHEYLADMEVRYVNDLNLLIYICCCKDRRPV